MASKDKVEQVRMTLRLTKEQDMRLREFAKANGLTKTDALRKVVDSYLFFETKKEMAIEHGKDSAAQELLKSELASEAVKRYESTAMATKSAGNMTPVQRQELIRAMATYQNELDEAVYQLKKVGTNLNQLAKHANATKKVDSKVSLQLKELLRYTKDVDKYVYEKSREVGKVWRTVE